MKSQAHQPEERVRTDELLVAAKIAVSHGDTAEGIARGIDAAEQRIREAVPSARVIYLEPDIRRPDTAPVTGAGAPPA